MAEKNLEDKIIKLDPLAASLDKVGHKGGAGKVKTFTVRVKSKEPNFFQFGKKVTGHSYKTDTKVKTDSAKNALDIAKKQFKQSKTFQNQKDNIPSSFETPSGKPMKPRVSAKIVSENFKGGLITGKPKLATKGWK